jgi:Ca-activated chloride channel family protein
MRSLRPIVTLLVSLSPALAAADPDRGGLRQGPSGGALEAELDGQPASLPLLKSDMRAQVRGDLATVELVQTFRNPHPRALHARYVFPLPPDAAVFAMRLVVDGRVVEAEIRERKEAEQLFEAAKQKGQQAALLTQHRPNVFTQRVANLTPGAEVRVELSYAHPVPRRDGAYAFHFPMVVGPRYLPGGSTGPGAGPPEPTGARAAVEPQALEIGQWNLPASPPVAPAADGARVSVQVELEAGQPIQWVASPSHALDIAEQGPGRRVIRLVGGRALDDQDFVLRYALAGEAASAGVTAWARGGRGVLSLHLEPPEGARADQITPRELVFVLDCSGSMHGEPIEASKRFMRRALGHLRPNDLFRIVQFSNHARELAGRPLPATPENVAAGLAYIDSLVGEGGTEMTHGILAALAPPVPPGALRLVVFLTDGYIGNDVDIVRLLQARRGEARLFSFGVGSGVNRYLLEEMARVGRGAARFVRPDEDAGEAADRLAERLDAPFLTDVRIDWAEGARVSAPTPKELPDLFLGQRLRVLARYEGAGPRRLQVHARLAGKPVSLPLEIELPAEAPGPRALDVLWARGQVEDRMQAYLDPSAGPARRAALRDEVIALGLAHRLVTRWTSFVAVARQVVNPGGQASEADVAVPQAKDVSALAYPGGEIGGGFTGGAAPEPATWAALVLAGLLGLLALRRVA